MTCSVSRIEWEFWRGNAAEEARKFPASHGRTLPITVLNEASVTATGLMIDVSQTGAALQLSNPIEVGTLVSVKYQSNTLMGEVRNCVHTRNGFRVGVELLGRD